MKKHLAIILVLALTSCAPAHVQTQQTADIGSLPPPSGVVVYDFAASPEQVRLDQGVGPRMQRMAGSMPITGAQARAAEQTQEALARELSAKLASYGLPVTRLPGSATPPPHTLLVQGQILSINQGNRTRRVLIGLGAGRSSISADAQLLYVTSLGHPELLQSFSADSNSGRMPGAIGTMGAGAIGGHIATSAALSGATHGIGEMRRTTDEENAIRIADVLARKIADYADAQGWIPPGPVR